MNWRDIINHPSCVLILGRRGSGKTALGFFLLEEFQNGEVSPYVLGLPPTKWRLLGDNIQGLELGDELPENSIIFVDEAAIWFFSRSSMTNFNKLINKLVSISRQKNQTLIFASHTTRKLDIGLILDMDVITWKEPSRLHTKFERKEIRALTEEALMKFERIKKEDRCRYSVVWSDVAEGEVMENALPSFWSDELSRGFEGFQIHEEIPKREVDSWNIRVIDENGEIITTYKGLAPALFCAHEHARKVGRDILVTSPEGNYLCSPSGEIMKV